MAFLANVDGLEATGIPKETHTSVEGLLFYLSVLGN